MIQIITTTDNIDNATIIEYKGLVSANIVIGANFFSDLAASLTDVFGGESSSYQNKLDELYDKVIDKIKQKASSLNANAIVGFKIDFDEISGKGKSMFMVTAIGTAIEFEYDKPIEVAPTVLEPQIEVEKIKDEVILPNKDLEEQNNQPITPEHIDNMVLGSVISGDITEAREILVAGRNMSLEEADLYIEEIKNEAGMN